MNQGITVHGNNNQTETNQSTVTSTRFHDQGQSSLCWSYSVASSIRNSLKVKIGKIKTLNFITEY